MIAVISIRYPQYQDQLLTAEGGHLFTDPVNAQHNHDLFYRPSLLEAVRSVPLPDIAPPRFQQ